MKKQFLEIGKIVAVQGLKGEVRVEVWCDNAEFFCGFETLYFEKGDVALAVERARPHKAMAVLKIKGIDTPEAASKLRNRVLYMNRSDAQLSEGSYFVQDLIGLRVLDADTLQEYGELIDVSKTGANDVYSIIGGGATYLVPAIPDVIIKTDIDGGQMLIRPMKGLFDDED